MADFILRVGCQSVQGLRSNNEDRFVVDSVNDVYLVADGMGGQEMGEQASGMAADIIPRAVNDRLSAKDSASQAIQLALREANQAILDAGRDQPACRGMGTTAVLAVKQENQVYIAGLGDSPAFLIRADEVEQLTTDHSVANALVLAGALSAEEARDSPWHHVLHRFLGCAELEDNAEVRHVTPQVGDRLLLATDGLTNHITAMDLREGPHQFPDPQAWAEHLVALALERGSRDNVTCVVLAFLAA